MHDEILEYLRDRSPVALMSASPDTTLTGWSPGAQRLLAYSADEVMGQPFASLAQSPSQLERVFGRLRRGDVVHTVCLTTQLLNKDGQEASVFLCVDALRDHGGDLQGFLVTARDLRTTILERAPEEVQSRLTVPDGSALHGLTPRQRLVLELMARGLSTREIARRLGRSVKTVETHRAQLMRRLNIHHVPGLVAFAIRAGLVTIE